MSKHSFGFTQRIFAPYVLLTKKKTVSASRFSTLSTRSYTRPLRKTPPGFLDFETAREEVRQLGLLTTTEWFEWRKGRNGCRIPSRPDRYYSEFEWLSWRDWLGTGVGDLPV
eukprot:CAMPEP_0196592696 /NCGR_PEP_ID=MMETSP1081-20130531/73525_1 /TAXON_ID=36882 /ORGANISM="Pyramimonas amylifera, Strain CCMP720" /LENGTH=111 /DNA_ID=CAMNT_0041916457 /DNA_START=115 /DNA_END=447 /DNA_ORIENTATION=+